MGMQGGRQPGRTTLEERLFALWRVPPDTLGDPLEAFGALYSDPVLINGAPMSVADLVARARALHVAFTAPTGRMVTGLGIDVLTLTGDRVTEIWVLADELQRLAQAGALALAS